MKKTIIALCSILLLCASAFAATIDTSKFETIEDFNGLPIGVQTAVLYEELIQDRVPDTEFQYYTMPTDMILALKSGKVAAYLVEAVGYGVHKANHPELGTFKEVPGYISASNIIGNNDKQERLLSEMNQFIRDGYENGLLGDDGSLYQYWIADFDPLTDNVGVKDFEFSGENGTLNIAVEGGYEPFSFVSDGNLAGFDVEFICRFCVEYGYRPIFNEIPFESIAPGVETGKFDIGMNIVVSEERNETGTLSDVYYTCPVLLVVLGSEEAAAPAAGSARAGSSDDASTFTRIEDFDGLPIGVQTAVLYEELIQDRVPKTAFQYYTMPTDMILALKSGKVAGYLVEAVGYGVHKANHPELDVFPEVPGYISASNIIGNNDKQERLLAEMNQFIRDGYENGLLGDDGSLYQYWIADFDPLTDNVGVKDFEFTGENGTLNIAVEGGYEPFSFVSDGNLAGFDVEFICRFCVEYGYRPIFNEIPFESIAPGVETGKFDIGMNIVVSEERNETGTLSDIYYTCPVYLVVMGSENKTAPAVSSNVVSSFTKIEDFNGLPIGVQTAVLYEELIQDRVPDTQFQYYTMPTDMILALKSGKVAAYLVEAVGYGVHKANHPDLDVFPEVPGYISASNIIGNNDKQERLLAEMNQFIRDGYSNGLLGEDGSLYQYWIADFDPLTDTTGVKDFEFSGENGTLNIAVEGGYEPFSFVSDGNLAGFDVEFICRFCVEYGYTPVFNEIPFESIAPGVETGKFDIGMNIVVSEERNETGTLSDVYYTCPVLLVVMGSDNAAEAVAASNGSTNGDTGFFAKIQNSFYKTFVRENRWKLFVSGAGVTSLITVCSILIGTILGFAVYMACRHGNVFANKTTNFFMWLIHGMPTVLFLMILYYIVFGSSRLSGMWISVVGFSLMFACSMIDMLRVGYNAIGKGQYEASTALGYSDGQSFFRILLPQAAHHFLPIYSNEVVTLIKETSVVGYIAVLDLTKISDLVRSRTYEAFFALILTAVVYFVIQGIMVRIVKVIQKKIDPRRRSDKKILEGIDTKDWELF